MNRWTVLFAAIIFSLFVAIGCSGGGGSPVAPSAGPEITSGSDNSGQIQHPNTSLLGYYDIYLDAGNQTMEVVEDRTASYTINIVPFLNQMTSPMYGISLGAIDFDDSDPGNLLVDVEFKWYHPFPTHAQYKVYDFMGVIISNGDTTLNYNNLRVGNYGNNTYMTNADGYTRWFNPTEFTTELIFGWAPGGIQNLKGSAKVNPFKAYGKALSLNGSLWSWLESGSNFDGMFQSGAGRTISLEFPMPTDGLVFGYAAVCCWEEQGAGPYTPYHREEPIAFRVTVEDNVWYDGTDSGGNLIADIDIWAWGDQPDTVKVESTVLAGIETATPTGGGGANWSTYEVDIPSDVPLTSNDGHEMWVIAECEGHNYINVSGVPAPSSSQTLAAFYRVPMFIASEPYNNCPEIISGVDGNATPSKKAVEEYTVDAIDADGELLIYTWTITDNQTGLPVPGFDALPDLTGMIEVDWGALGVAPDETFDIDCVVDDGQCFTPADTLAVTIVNATPICELIVVTPMPAEWFVEVPVEFDATGSIDPDGDPMTFMWDFDDDGTFGDPYDSGTDDNPTYLYDADFTGDVCVQVADDSGAMSECCEPIEVIVKECGSPPCPSGSPNTMIGTPRLYYWPPQPVQDANTRVIVAYRSYAWCTINVTGTSMYDIMYNSPSYSIRETAIASDDRVYYNDSGSSNRVYYCQYGPPFSQMRTTWGTTLPSGYYVFKLSIDGDDTPIVLARGPVSSQPRVYHWNGTDWGSGVTVPSDIMTQCGNSYGYIFDFDYDPSSGWYYVVERYNDIGVYAFDDTGTTMWSDNDVWSACPGGTLYQPGIFIDKADPECRLIVMAGRNSSYQTTYWARYNPVGSEKTTGTTYGGTYGPLFSTFYGRGCVQTVGSTSRFLAATYGGNVWSSTIVPSW